MHAALFLLALLPTVPPHWAFQPVGRVDPPAGPERHPIDRFIGAELRRHNILPAPSADRRTLIRRLTFDLIGLPPTPREIDEFLADRSPGADAIVVERLLASPHYGERWGRHWMDVVRYADTAGDNADYPIPEARLYRDWIIDAFNADQPYDEFVRDQIAGDILARRGPRERYAQRVVATGYLALARRYLTVPYERWHLTLEDVIDTTGRAFLGLTLRCARCHDHKFDPVTRNDYYALYGIFASTQFPFAGSEEFASMKAPRQHFVPLLPPAEAGPMMQAHRERVKHLEAEIARGDKEKWPREKLDPLRQELLIRQRRGAPEEMPLAYAVSEGTPADAPVQMMGEPDKLGAVVKRGVPAFLAPGKPLVTDGDSGRLGLAHWLTDAGNPLFARVMVNRIWQHHFGRGLVPTPSNFGRRGEPPTHPALLDFLTRRFIDSGWSMKAMHRFIVASETYQRASSNAPQSYAGFERRRLDAEAIRDAMMAVAGTLDRRRPGAHPFPPIHAWGWTQHNPFRESYPSPHRSVYLMTQRFQRHQYLCLFDGPDTNTTTDVRTTATVPSQALFLMNGAFVREQSVALAKRLLRDAGDDLTRGRLLHELALGRPPSPEETQRVMAYLRRFRSELPSDAEAWASIAKVMLSANEFMYID